MENSYKYFSNKSCQYYPCHNIKNSDEFNCLFCYCPLYRIEDCGGNYTILKNGIKDCSNCMIPHSANGYNYIISKLS